MFEFRYMPPEHNIMLHQAARRQVETVHACAQLQTKTRHEITAGLTTALSMLTPITVKCPCIDPALLHTVVSRSTHRYRLKGATCHLWPNIEVTGAVIEVHRIQCLSPEAVFAQLGAYLDLLQLIQCLDALMCRNPMMKRTTLARTSRFLSECGTFYGRDRCERAMRLARENTDSPRETELRLILERFGLRMVTVNFPLMTDSGKRWLDLAIPEYRIGIEYDGHHHRLQHQEDLERLHDLQSELWTIFVVTNDVMCNTILLDRFIRSLKLTLIHSGMSQCIMREQPMTLRELSDGRRNR